jgi:hypothetical protein
VLVLELVAVILVPIVTAIMAIVIAIVVMVLGLQSPETQRRARYRKQNLLPHHYPLLRSYPIDGAARHKNGACFGQYAAADPAR